MRDRILLALGCMMVLAAVMYYGYKIGYNNGHFDGVTDCEKIMGK